jgi:cobalt/nickel transport system permease protein
MHMADALLSPAVGGVLWAAGAAALGVSVHKIRQSSPDEKNIPIMGVMGAFVFAGQMINFTIPATGSSGHISGGILLAALLGPWSAFITLAAVLLIQCLFFADGGLLAYGCNIINMAAISCLFSFELIYRPLIKRGLDAGGLTPKRIAAASVITAVVSAQLGAAGVVLETTFSGITELPFLTFVALMQPIHLAIGLVEGLVTASVLCFIWKARPELLENAVNYGHPAKTGDPSTAKPVKPATIVWVFAALSVVVAGGLSLFASSNPDGLEWAMEKTAGTAELEREGGIFDTAAETVEKTAIFPDYALKDGEGAAAETTIAGIAGSIITAVIACGIGLAIYAARRGKKAAV